MHIQIDNINNGLLFIYFIAALFLLAVAIIAYPTLKDQHSRSSKKSR